MESLILLFMQNKIEKTQTNEIKTSQELIGVIWLGNYFHGNANIHAHLGTSRNLISSLNGHFIIQVFNNYDTIMIINPPINMSPFEVLDTFYRCLFEKESCWLWNFEY